jgi:hypothetical protein
MKRVNPSNDQDESSSHKPAPLKISLKLSPKVNGKGGIHSNTIPTKKKEETGTHSSMESKASPYEFYISSLYNFMSENQEDILLDPELLKDFEDLTRISIAHAQGNSSLKEILMQHGWTGSQFVLSKLNVDSLTQALGTLYLSKVMYPRMMAEEQAEYDANPNLFAQEDSLIKSFIPNSLLNIHLANIMYELFCDAKDMKVKSTKVYGAVVLADISGFTKMSARHCQDGSKGLDKLHQATNIFLGRLVKTVYSYGGDGTYFVHTLYYIYHVLYGVLTLYY